MCLTIAVAGCAQAFDQFVDRARHDESPAIPLLSSNCLATGSLSRAVLRTRPSGRHVNVSLDAVAGLLQACVQRHPPPSAPIAALGGRPGRPRAEEAAPNPRRPRRKSVLPALPRIFEKPPSNGRLLPLRPSENPAFIFVYSRVI